jgi:hypothetical protein
VVVQWWIVVADAEPKDVRLCVHDVLGEDRVLRESSRQLLPTGNSHHLTWYMYCVLHVVVRLYRYLVAICTSRTINVMCL